MYKKGILFIRRLKGGICMPRAFYRYIIVITFIISLSFSYGYLKTFLSIKNPNENAKPDDLEQNVYKMPEMKLNAKAKLIYITYYVGCGDEVIEEKYLNDKYIGYTKSELAQHEINWDIDSFTSDEVKLKREVHDICGNHYYIGIQSGYVALFRGIPGIKSTLVERTDIIADTLREDDRLILEKGLIINGEQEFLKIREGLTN
jgi:hypothetical protein